VGWGIVRPPLKYNILGTPPRIHELNIQIKQSQQKALTMKLSAPLSKYTDPLSSV
jgi:hypothetical protein